MKRIIVKLPETVDVHVGQRVRSRRLELKITQEKLADALGITFQQIQKYEKGTNRISASRLNDIARTLAVSPSYFFEGASKPGRRESRQTDAQQSKIEKFVASSEGASLVSGFSKVKSGRLRKTIVKFVEHLAEGG